MRRIVFGAVILAIGVMMTLRTMGVNDFSWFFNGGWHKYIIPGIIIVVGIRVITSPGKKNNSNGFKLCEVPETEEGNPMNVSAAFSGSAYNLNGEDFNGAKLDAFLGGIKIDLRGANITDGSVINIHTFMGGVELKLPQDVRVEINSSCFIGGVNNKMPQNYSSAVKTIRINANCLLGGVDIKS